MPAGSDPLAGSSSFTARRPNAFNLPSFELPPPQLSNLSQKHQSYLAGNGSQSGATAPIPANLASVGNLLTPPSSHPADGLSPISAAAAAGSSNNALGGAPYTQSSYLWSHSGSQAPNSYAFQSANSAAAAAAAMGAGNAQQAYGSSRSLVSSSVNPLSRTTGSPTGSEGLPTQAFDVNHSSSSLVTASMPLNSSLSSMSPPPPSHRQHYQQQHQHQHQHHQHHQQQQHQQQQQQQHHEMINTINTHTPASGSSTLPSPLNVQDSFQSHTKLSHTPSFHSQPSTATSQHSSFSFSGPSPPQPSPLSIGSLARMSPPNSAGPLSASSTHSPLQYQRPYGSFSLPGPVLTAMSNPNSHLALVGGMPNALNLGFGPSPGSIQHLYGSSHHHHQQHAQQQQPPAERPFKCDQCQQSFNRNHDLKRHKRIHLAVKPFPCGHCEKSFSRKDALKRHILVKGCGKSMAAVDGVKKEGSVSSEERSHHAGEESESKHSV